MPGMVLLFTLHLLRTIGNFQARVLAFVDHVDIIFGRVVQAAHAIRLHLKDARFLEKEKDMNSTHFQPI